MPHGLLKDVYTKLNRQLIDHGVVGLDQFALDSKPVMAATKENSFKNSNRNTRNKEEKPNRNPHATLSYYSCQVVTGKKENLIFFWGYRTQVIVSKEGLCLVELTLPNNVTDAAPSRVPRNSKLFKETTKQRQVVEQHFARLGDREAEQTTRYALKSVRNQTTLAHIALSMVAVAAVLLNSPEKMRCFRTFAHHAILRETG